MKLYDQVIAGTFLRRPNRFIAHVETDRGEEICHVKNTGRCREILVPGARVYLSVSDNAARKTRCDVIAVEKGKRLINMDSQAPNRAAMEAIPRLFPGAKRIRPECVFGDSRLDFYIETDNRKIFMEVKGVTLEEKGVASFPDAPTERGIKHLKELEKCLAAGYEAAVLFVIQMQDIRYFTPNWRTHPAFGEALSAAKRAGVQILAYDCLVEKDGMTVGQPVAIRLEREEEVP
ncbi:MAG: DNA/RNA nuclease SfsA [Clostridiales bacterium]|nr:DNA/RNA nuclease SfsA [Clostridiales bacterium]